MKVHLIGSEEFSHEEFSEVLEFLQSFDGPVQFFEGKPARFRGHSLTEKQIIKDKFFRKEEVYYNICEYNDAIIPMKRIETNWKALFELCQQTREESSLPPTDLVILLTEIANEPNWFSALDPDNMCNGFVHTAEWEHYVRCSKVFPVAYLVASLVLQKHMFKDMQSLRKAVHEFPMGCINDFCRDKQQIILKLRTADICIDCMDLLKDKLQPPEIYQMLRIFEGVRIRMLFNQNFRPNLPPSRMQVTSCGKLFLQDYGNMEIKLTPLEKTLYLFFLNHPEGMMLHDLVDHKKELIAIYTRISTTGLLAEVHNGINGLVDVTSNSASEKISRIKAAFVKSVGEQLATHYYIQGERNGKKRIPLDRKLVKNEFNVMS
jgi:hypothetical protein